MSFWTAFSDELKKIAVGSMNLEDTQTSGEHAAALDTNDEKGAKPVPQKEKDKVTSMSMAKAKNGGKVMKKIAACMKPGRKIRSKGKGRGLGIGKGKGPIGRMA